MDDSFSTEDSVSIGVDIKIKITEMDGKSVKLIVWDTAGQEKFRSITSSLFRGAQGILLVYDVSDATTFTNAKRKYLFSLQISSCANFKIASIFGRFF